MLETYGRRMWWGFLFTCCTFGGVAFSLSDSSFNPLVSAMIAGACALCVMGGWYLSENIQDKRFKKTLRRGMKFCPPRNGDILVWNYEGDSSFPTTTNEFIVGEIGKKFIRDEVSGARKMTTVRELRICQENVAARERWNAKAVAKMREKIRRGF